MTNTKTKIILAFAIMVGWAAPTLFGDTANALPQDGTVAAGGSTITQPDANTMHINQSTDKAIINWQGYSIGANEKVQYFQPDSGSISLNRVVGQDPSLIYGQLSANGQVWVINPNGLLVGQNAKINVGGFLASTLNINDNDFLDGNYKFQAMSYQLSAISNYGNINAADGGYVVFISPTINNQGSITANNGSVNMASGDDVTLTFANNSLINLVINKQTAADALGIDNSGTITADGGQVIISAQTAGDLLKTVINNTGIIQARTIENKNGVIKLLGGMDSNSNNTIQVGGTLDASAPNGGDGGFIETSAASVKVSDSAVITTLAPYGNTGTWLIDPNDYTIAASGGDITGSQLSTNLGSNNVIILSNDGGNAGNGDIFVNDTVSWSANTTLTLSAYRNVDGTLGLIDSSGGAGNVILRADNTGTGPGAAAGTVILGTAGVKLGTGTATVYYNPASYAALTDYGVSGFITGGTTISQALVFVNNASATAQSRAYDGTTTATLSGPFAFLTGPDGVTAGQIVSLSAGTADFNSKDVATATTVNFVGYGLAGGNSASYSLFSQPASQLANVTTAALTVTANADSKTYDGLAYTGGNGVGYSGFVNNETSSVLGGTLAYSGTSQGAINAGSYVITPSGQTSGNYTISYNNGTLTVNTAPLTVTANAASKTYDGLAYSGGNGVGYSGFVNSETSAVLGGALAYSGTSQGAINAGNYVITPGGQTSGNYTITFANGALTVTPAALTVTANADSKTYDALPYTGGNGVAYSGFVNGETSAVLGGALAYSGTSQNAVNAGSYTITPSGQTSSNYTISYNNGALTVNPAPLTITANADTKTYNGTAYNGGNGVAYTGFVNGETFTVLGGRLTYSGTSQGATNAGSYTITPGGYASGNYTITYNNGTLTVTPAALTITAQTNTKTYDSNSGAAAIPTITSGALFGTDTANFSETYDTQNAGPGKTLTASGTVNDGNSGNNYTYTFLTNTTGVINPAPLTIIAATNTKTYDSNTGAAAIPAITSGTVFSGSGDTANFSETYDTQNAGTGKTLTVSGTVNDGNGGNNYTYAFVTDTTGVINPAPLTVTADDKSKIYGDANPALTATYSGLKGTDTSAVVSGLLLATTATPASNAGGYAITASGASASNYDITYVDGILTVVSYTTVIGVMQEGLGNFGGNELNESAPQEAKYEAVYAAAESPVFTFTANGRSRRPLITDYRPAKWHDGGAKHACLIMKRDGNPAIVEADCK